MANYTKLDADVTSLKQHIDFINRYNTYLDPTTALALLTLPTSVKYSIKRVAVQNEESFLNVQIEGGITASDLKEIQSTYELIVEQLGKIPGYIISSSSVNAKLRTFNIQARYYGDGKHRK